MVDVIHRTTLEFIPSVSTPFYPEPTWKHDPDMTAVGGVPWTVAQRYWKAPADWDAVGAGPVEMTQGEKDATDTALAQAAADVESDYADTSTGGLDEAIWQAIRQVLREVNQDHNKLASRIRECELAFDAIKSTSGGSDNIRAAIPNASADVIAERPAPAVFTDLGDRLVGNFVSDYRQGLRDKEGQV